jgi:predicted transposase YdaD
MLGLSELKQTKVYQKALEAGRQMSKQRSRVEGRTGEAPLDFTELWN